MKLHFANVQLLPFYITGDNKARALELPYAISRNDPDIICMCEAYDIKSVNTIGKTLLHSYPYQHYTGLKGGLFVATKSPINITPQFVQFSHNGKGFDLLGRKGFLVVQLKNVCLILTHLQAGETTLHYSIRRKQMLDIEYYVKYILNRSNQRSVLLVGDLNENIQICTRHHHQWIMPIITEGSNTTTFSPQNPLLNRTDSMLLSQPVPTKSIYDWAITFRNRPVSKLHMTIKELKSDTSVSLYTGIYCCSRKIRTFYLSDHNMICVTFDN